MQLFCLQLEASCLQWSFFTFNWQFQLFYLQLELFSYSEKVRLISALRDCKQRSLTVSKKLQLYPPPQQKTNKNNSLRVFLCNFWGRLWSNFVNTKKLTPQELLCVIGGCRDPGLFHVELREIYVTPEKRMLREFYCVIDYAQVSPSLRI